jgi:thymidylate synthase
MEKPNATKRNLLDKQYQSLLQDILDNGVTKQTRNGSTVSVFGRQIRHKMSDGFPILTTKKVHFKSIVTELLWFLRGDTNIKFLVDNDCHIWDGDAYKNYERRWETEGKFLSPPVNKFTKEELINGIKTNPMVAKELGELGPIYGKQWRSWREGEYTTPLGLDGPSIWKEGIDQIANLINDLKTNPDSRRLMVNAWNVGELDQMVLPPCHYGFQVYTRELSNDERFRIAYKNLELRKKLEAQSKMLLYPDGHNKVMDDANIPTRTISLMWNQRSVDTFLGLPFNIASYGLLLEIIAKTVNMVPDELIGNLGDVHLYSDHVEQAKEQIGRELSLEERHQLALPIWKEKYGPLADMMVMTNVDNTPYNIPTRTREPYPLPTLNINTEFWPYEGGSCGEGPLDAIAVMNGFKDDNFCKCLLEADIQLSNYQSHPSIKAPLSN